MPENVNFSAVFQHCRTNKSPEISPFYETFVYLDDYFGIKLYKNIPLKVCSLFWTAAFCVKKAFVAADGDKPNFARGSHGKQKVTDCNNCYKKDADSKVTPPHAPSSGGSAFLDRPVKMQHLHTNCRAKHKLLWCDAAVSGGNESTAANFAAVIRANYGVVLAFILKVWYN